MRDKILAEEHLNSNQTIPTPTISHLRQSAKEDREKRLKDRTVSVEEYKKKQMLTKDNNTQIKHATPPGVDTFDKFVMTADHPTDEILADRSAKSSQGLLILEQDQSIEIRLNEVIDEEIDAVGVTLDRRESALKNAPLVVQQIIKSPAKTFVRKVVSKIRTPKIPSKPKASSPHSGLSTPSENKIKFSNMRLIAQGTQVSQTAPRTRNLDIDKIINEATLAKNQSGKTL